MGLFGSTLQCWDRGYSLTHKLLFSPLGEITSEKDPVGTELCHFRGEVMWIQTVPLILSIASASDFFSSNAALELLC